MSKGKLRQLFEAMRKADRLSNEAFKAKKMIEGSPEEFEAELTHQQSLRDFTSAKSAYDAAMKSFLDGDNS